MSGIAGRTNYADWNKKTSSLLSELESEEEAQRLESKAALGHDKHSFSSAEAEEKDKLAKAAKVKKLLDSYKKRENSSVQEISNVLENNKKTTRFITRDDVDAGKRVLNISDTTGPGHIILTEDLSNLESRTGANTTLEAKSYPEDFENAAEMHKSGKIYGIVKVHLSNVNDCTLTFKCKVITGLLEVSHCRNLTIKLSKESTIVTVQADLCQNLTIEFHDAPSGKGITQPGVPTTKFWGDDADDRIFHAGVENLVVKTFRDGILDLGVVADYKKDGAVTVGNASAEEVQFVINVVNGELVNERVLRQGSATGTTIAGAVSGEGGMSARAMTAREMKEVEMKKKEIQKALDGTIGNGIKIIDKDGNEVVKKAESKTSDDDELVIEEVYAGMNSDDIKAIVTDCETQKSKGNESFGAGEYAQAILLYTLALDRASELPDASEVAPKNPLFARHVVLSNRSACFLKLGEHEKALKDAIDAAKMEPTYIKAIFRQGLALHAMGRYQEAIEQLAAALKLEPKNKQVKQALQFAEVRMHQEIRKRMEG